MENRGMTAGAVDVGTLGDRLQGAGAFVLRYGLVLILCWIGAMKFTAYEAEGIKPLVANSPFLGWMYRFMGPQTASNLFGVVEIAVAALIAVRPLSPRTCALGSALATGMFLMTLTFLFSTPG